RNPSFTVVAVLTLALAIGANTAIFSVVNAVLFQPLDYEEPDRLYLLWTTNPGWPRPESASLPDFLDWREQNQVFEDLAAISRRSLNLTGDGEPERLIGSYVSSSFFSLLRVQPSAGRGFLPEEDAPGAEHVAVLGYGLWQRRFGAEPSLVGKTISLNGNDHTVVGIAPEDFQLFQGTDLWLPLALDASQPQFGRRSDFLRVLGRLKPDVREDRAQAEMTTIAKRLEQEYPQTNTNIGVVLVPLHEHFVGNVRPALLVLLGAAGFVLLIACANVANLLLARISGREKEIAIRAALGASRGRIMAQILTESSLLSLLGGLGALVVATAAVRGLAVLHPESVPRLAEVEVDTTVLLFNLGLIAFVTLAVGLIPALRVSRLALHETLKEGGRQGGGVSRHRTRAALVVTEVALATVLLVGAGLLIRSFQQLMAVDPGFRPEQVLTTQLSLSSGRYPNQAARAEFFRRLTEDLEAQPGVVSAAVINVLPMSGVRDDVSIGAEGYTPPNPDLPDFIEHRMVTPDYFKTLGVPVLKGRPFTDQDRKGSQPVAILSQSLARKFWGDQDPIGRRVKPGGIDSSTPWHTVVGVVGEVHHDGAREGEVPIWYKPVYQQSWNWMHLAVRTTGDPAKRFGW
ncbi:MAG: ABC transporter permease, partial [Acidobacteria bacterium]|nr:ABC transporter permease [Acidobacteriota bacterium]